MSNNLDKVDKRILILLQSDARIPIASLAEQAHTSTASVQRRLKKLRESGVIEREVAIVDPEQCDNPLSFVILVEIERESLDQLDAFRRRARADPQIQQCYCVTGETDFILIVLTKSMADFERFTHRFFFKDANVRRFRTSVVITRDKAGLNVLLDE